MGNGPSGYVAEGDATNSAAAHPQASLLGNILWPETCCCQAVKKSASSQASALARIHKVSTFQYLSEGVAKPMPCTSTSVRDRMSPSAGLGFQRQEPLIVRSFPVPGETAPISDSKGRSRSPTDYAAKMRDEQKRAQNCKGNVMVRIIAANKFAKPRGFAGDVSAKYVMARVGVTEERTETIDFSCEPRWDPPAELRLPVRMQDSCLDLEIVDEETRCIIGRTTLEFRKIDPERWHNRLQKLSGSKEAELEFQAYFETENHVESARNASKKKGEVFRASLLGLDS